MSRICVRVVQSGTLIHCALLAAPLWQSRPSRSHFPVSVSLSTSVFTKSPNSKPTDVSIHPKGLIFPEGPFHAQPNLAEGLILFNSNFQS